MKTWIDPRLRWDPSQYGNKTTIVVPEDDVWLPPTVIYNAWVIFGLWCLISKDPDRQKELLFLWADSSRVYWRKWAWEIKIFSALSKSISLLLWLVQGGNPILISKWRMFAQFVIISHPKANETEDEILQRSFMKNQKTPINNCSIEIEVLMMDKVRNVKVRLLLFNFLLILSVEMNEEAEWRETLFTVPFSSNLFTGGQHGSCLLECSHVVDDHVQTKVSLLFLPEGIF